MMTAAKRTAYIVRKIQAHGEQDKPVLDTASDAVLADMMCRAPSDGIRDYVIEDDLTDEETASLDECLQEYKEHPESFVALKGSM